MSFRSSVVEASLNRAEFTWKRLRLMRQTLVLGTAVCVLVLLVGLSITAGYVTSKSIALDLFVGVAVLGLLVWGVVLISVLAGSVDRSWLGAALERMDRSLMDRLNTLLFLERRSREPRADAFGRRIARQTQAVLVGNRPRVTFPSLRLLPSFAAFVLALLGTLVFYRGTSPWRQLEALEKRRATPPQEVAPPMNLALPPTNSFEQDLNWGEVRITDPGVDLKVTKVDVVPLQIEAAANQPLKDVNWFSTVNGGEEAAHQLPAPSEPRYAVYQPDLYLDELQLSDWDVLTYYAKARTDQQNSFASDVYFLEVRPFREDILKLPGGDRGRAYECLNEMSALISRQQLVIRQTHQHLQRPPEEANLQAQERKKLSGAESDLGDSTAHLYAKMAGQMENAPIGEALDNLAKARGSLDSAGKELDANSMPVAQSSERRALTELVAARKMFQKAVTDNPKAFDKTDEPDTAAVPSQQLTQMAEFRDETKASLEFIRKSLEQQHELERQQRTGSPNKQAELAGKEQRLGDALGSFESQHPKVFKGIEEQSTNTLQSISHAADSLKSQSSDARAATREASRQLEKLSEALNSHSAQEQLADAYRLKQMLDKEIQTLDRGAEPTNQVPDSELQQAASAARETVNQLKNTAEQEPTRDAFGQPLRDSLSGQRKVDLDAKLMRLERPRRLSDVPESSGKEQRAAEARDALAKVSKAFELSEPSTMQFAHRTDSLKPGEQDSFAQGMAELGSLLKQLESQHQLSSQDQGGQGREALFNLQTGMRSRYGDNERGNQLLLHLEQMLNREKPLEVANLKQLMDELEHFSAETADRIPDKDKQAELTNIDPSKLPPAYRGRIQKYFQKLSER